MDLFCFRKCKDKVVRRMRDERIGDRFTGFFATFNEAIALLGLVYLGVKRTRGLTEKLAQDRINVVFWLLLALSGIVSIIFSPYKTISIASFFIPFVFIYLYILGRYSIADPEIFMRSLLRGAAALSLVAVLAKIFQLQWSIGSFRILAKFSGGERGEVLYVGDNLLGLMAQVGVVGALGSLLTNRWNKKYFIEDIAIFLLGIGALFVSGSRGAIMGSLAGLLFLALNYNLLVSLAVTIVLLGLFIMVALVRGGGNLLNMLWDPRRVIIWRTAFRVILARPLFGWGPGVFIQIFDKYRPPQFTESVTCAHSDYLNIFAGWGLIGGFLFWGWQLFIIIRAWLNRLTSLQQIIVAILLSFYVHVAVNDLFAVYAGLLLGLLQHPSFSQTPMLASPAFDRPSGVLGKG
ncbi:MAG: O-antigen ligase family protein [Bacillota bacterium]